MVAETNFTNSKSVPSATYYQMLLYTYKFKADFIIY